MLSRAARVAIAVLLALSGCTSYVHYAVIAPHEVVSEDQGCFRQCQMMHAGETKKHVACVRSCPGVRVVDDSECKDISFDAQKYRCTTERAQKFDPTFGIIAVALLVVASIAIAAAAPSGM
jgi:hypothetical protein